MTDQWTLTREDRSWEAVRIDEGVMKDVGWLDVDPVIRAEDYIMLALRFKSEPATMTVPELQVLGYGIGQDKEARSTMVQQALDQKYSGVLPPDVSSPSQLYQQVVNAGYLYLLGDYEAADAAVMGYKTSPELQAKARQAADTEIGSVNLWDQLSESDKRKRWETAYRTELERLQRDVPVPLDLATNPGGAAAREDGDIVRWAMKPQGESRFQKNIDYGIDMTISVAAIAGLVAGAGYGTAGLIGASQTSPLFQRIAELAADTRGLLNVKAALREDGYLNALKFVEAVQKVARTGTRWAYKGGKVVAYGTAASAIGGQGYSLYRAATDPLDPNSLEAYSELQQQGGRDNSLPGPQATPAPDGTILAQGMGASVAGDGGATSRTETPVVASGMPLTSEAYIGGGAPLFDANSTAYEDDPYIGVGGDYTAGGNRFFNPQTLRYEQRPRTVMMKDPTTNQWTEVDAAAYMASHPNTTLGDKNRYGTPVYRQSDLDRILGSIGPGQLPLVESQLIRAGLLDPDAKVAGARYVAGRKSGHVRAAMEGLLATANAGIDGGPPTVWQNALGILAEKGDEAGINNENTRPGFVARPYLPPDYATLTNRAKEAVRKTLGRDINDWEMNILAEGMKADYRQQYEVQSASDRAIWDAQGRAEETFDDQTTGTFQQVDPEARFQAKFQDMFADEIDARERWSKVQDSTSNLMGGLSRLSGMVGS